MHQLPLDHSIFFTVLNDLLSPHHNIARTQGGPPRSFVPKTYPRFISRLSSPSLVVVVRTMSAILLPPSLLPPLQEKASPLLPLPLSQQSPSFATGEREERRSLNLSTLLSPPFPLRNFSQKIPLLSLLTLGRWRRRSLYTSLSLPSLFAPNKGFFSPHLN